MAKFSDLAVAPAILDSLNKLGIINPTPIQEKAIPIGLEGKDLVGIAQTGTGKTFGFGIPMIQRLASGGGGGLVLLPTRELALQVEEEFKKIGSALGTKVAVLIGGANINPQIASLRRNPNIIVATPGRLIDHLEQKTLSLDKVKILVLDEADRMLDMGFAPQLKKIFERLPKQRQTMLFSATMPHEIMQIANKEMRLPLRIEVAPQGSTAEKVTQEIYIVDKNRKTALLGKILGESQLTTLVFTRTKFGAKRLARSVRDMGYTAVEIHGNRSQSQRQEALAGFKNGKYRVLIATDIAARGIDVSGIGLVVNFDLPTVTEDYVHRIGRTARGGAAGHAISFVMHDERRDLQAIERLIRKTLPVRALPSDLPTPPPAPPRESHFNTRTSRSGSGFSGRPKHGSSPQGHSSSPGGHRHRSHAPHSRGRRS